MNNIFHKEVTDKYDGIPGLIGQGSFGSVWRVKEKSITCIGSNNIYAIKVLERSEEYCKNLKNEIRILSEINHPYVTHLKEKIEVDNTVYLIMDYFENKDLGKAMADQVDIPFEEDEIWKYFIQTCLGLKCLHAHHIIHRDIKPQNIFLDKDKNVKIGDFGLSRFSQASSVAGTQRYFSPEMCDGDPPTYKSDVWALGCTLYELCNFEHPFGDNPMKIKTEKHLPIRAKYSNELRSVVDRCLEKEMTKRPTVDDLLEGWFIARKAKSLGIYNADYFPPVKWDCYCVWQCILLFISWLGRPFVCIWKSISSWIERICRAKKTRVYDSSDQTEAQKSRCWNELISWLMCKNRKKGNDHNNQESSVEKVPLVGEESDNTPFVHEGSDPKNPPFVYEESGAFKSVGIPNYGNTCYLNSIIQVLAHVQIFVNLVEKSNSNTFKCLSKIFKLVKSNRPQSRFEPLIKNFLKELGQNYPMFTAMAQNDCKELYNILIDNLFEESPDVRNPFLIVKNQAFVCEKGHQSLKSESQLFLIITTGYKLDPEKCIKNIKEKEFTLELFCESCGNIKNTRIVTKSLDLPEYLVFYVAGTSNQGKVPKNNIKDEKKEYELFAVICYYGNGSFGHYIAFALNADKRWIKYNDAFVDGEDPDYNHAYMLFYRQTLS